MRYLLIYILIDLLDGSLHRRTHSTNYRAYRTEAGLIEGEMKIQQLSRMQFCTYVAAHPKLLMIQEIDLR